MDTHSRSTLLFAALLAANGAAHAQADSSAREAAPAESHAVLPAVVVTGNPLGNEQLVSPTNVLQGSELMLRQSRTLGETLDNTPGVSSTSYGPGASRPIIRGLDGDRIRILQNGLGSLDASALSYDHAVPQDVSSADRIEVLRGPAALLYGGSAIGGVINTLDDRIPREPVTEISGQIDAAHGSGASENLGSTHLNGGNGQFAVSADFFSRHSKELRIPGYAWSARQRAGQGSWPIPEEGAGDAADVRGRLPNSGGRAEGGSIGASWTGSDGYLGAAYSTYDSNYGSVAEPDVRLRMHQERFTISGERRNLNALGGFLKELKVDFGHTDYQHREIESGTVGTTFLNKGFDARIQARHARLGPLEGVFGLQLGDSQFSALGEEAFVPQVKTRSSALFLLEQWQALPALRLDFGARHEFTRLDADAAGNARFAGVPSRRFNATSYSVGALYALGKPWSLTGNLAYTQRAPSFYELYADGAHVATGAFERGNPDMRTERSVSTEIALAFESGANKARVSAYYSRFSNYIGLASTGRYCIADEAGDECAVQAQEGALPEYEYTQMAARFYGLEAQGRARLSDGPLGRFDLDVWGDITRADNLDNGQPLPRISPLRIGTALSWQRANWQSRVEVVHAASQNRIPTNETPTSGYTTVGAQLSYRFRVGSVWWQAYLRGVNLTNQEVRLATSMLRDISPQVGRSYWVGMRALF